MFRRHAYLTRGKAKVSRLGPLVSEWDRMVYIEVMPIGLWSDGA